jgi:integrase
VTSARDRRRRGLSGTVVKRGRKWAYVIDLSPDPVSGKRRQQWGSGFESEAAAWDALADVNGQVRNESFVKPVNLTVVEFLTRWLDTIRVEIKPTTHANYAALANAYVIPHIGHRKMRDIDPQVISELYRRLLTSGRRKSDTNTIMFEHWKEQIAAGRDATAADLARVANVGYSTGARALARYRAARYPAQAGMSLSPKTIASIHIMLRAAFNDAASKSWMVIADNPVPHASRPRVPRANRTTWKPADLTAFLRVSRSDRLYAMWLLFATTGVRRSEVAGAEIAGLDLEAHELSIGPTRVVAAGRAQESDGKSANSVRAFGLDPVTIRVLRGHLDMLSRERVVAGDAYSDHGLLFCWADGGRIYPDTITRQFNRLVDRAGVPRIGLHDVRHTYATMALRAGVNPKIVSRRLGHASVAFTLEVYTDSVPELDRTEAERVASLFLTSDLDLDPSRDEL